MRRAVTAVLITIVVTVLLVNFKARPALTIGSASQPPPVTTTTPSRSRSSASAPKSASKSAPKATPVKRRTIVGPAVSTEYGTVQVAATVAGKRLQDVRALVMPSGSGRTNEISAQAAPLLRQEAVAAHSAQIDTISGASYTSEGYRESLQAALDQAHA
jgi:uncharacterized protein with FMN-binding domain